MNVPTGLVPSCLIPEVYAAWKDEPGFVAGQVERIAAEGFYGSVELSPVEARADRDRIRRVCAEHSVFVAVWLTSVLEREGLDFCAVDEASRRDAVEAVKRLLPAALECGAGTVALVGGSDPGPALRERGYESCRRSLIEIAAEAANLGASVMMEPLDRYAHKKRLVGPTDETVALFARVRAEQPDFGFAFDTAHAALNGEEVSDAIALAGDQVVNLHLSNAVLDPQDPLYGDHHMMPGPPGFLTLRKAAEIIVQTGRLGDRLGRGIRIAMEARAPLAEDPQFTARLAHDFLVAALKQAETIGAAH
ncbi:MAG: sugar phosphate isomerase/epimerase family protein [Tropicimonas sp.]|uniref:sugar phosphate isomerase/epimerase family protein n=1 Tax=Tropicimonas sp. TaxID=2067044 RepID=UPI003A83DA48